MPKYKVDHAAFCAEAMVLKNLDHPGIPLVYDLEEDADYFYLIEEYLEGCRIWLNCLAIRNKIRIGGSFKVSRSS